MAVARSSSEPRKSLFIAMGIFIVLFLATTGISVIMYMGQSKLVSEKETAESQLGRIANPTQLNQIQTLAGIAGPTAMDRITDDMQYMSGLIAGETAGSASLEKVRSLVQAEKDTVEQELKNAVSSWSQKVNEINAMGEMEITLADGALFVIPQGLSRIVINLVGQTTNLLNRLGEVQTTYQREIITLQNRIAGQQDAIIALTEQRKKDIAAAKTMDDNYTVMLSEAVQEKERENTELKDRYQQMQSQQEQALQENGELSRANTQLMQEVKTIKDRLLLFQPNPETEMAALEDDGEITLVVPPPPAEPQYAYINLGKNDHIYRGLTFAVYDRYLTSTERKSGQGKGSLEVIEIMDSISRCRIVSPNPGEIIREQDVIANLVWDRDRKYRFCVTGEFDIDGDDKIDPDGYQRIVKLIEQWGGEVTDSVSVNTDFLVYGEQPRLPETPEEEYAVSNEEFSKSFQEAQAQVGQYNKNMNDGQALGVPSFNRSRFLYFIGYYKQATRSR